VGSKIEELEKQLEAERAKQLRVTFYSPGTFFCEQSSFEVEGRDLSKCAAMAKTDVTERYNAKPFGFRFEDGNGKKLSGMHYLTGRVITYDEVPDDAEHRIMRCNMRDPLQCVVVENTNSFRYTGEFAEKDVILDWDGAIVRRGDDADLVDYRRKFKERYDSGEFWS
jgi:hypothetical protein